MWEVWLLRRRPPTRPRTHALLLQIAVLREIGGKGPYCSLVMAAVVVKDVVVFIAFAIIVELVGVAMALDGPGRRARAAAAVVFAAGGEPGVERAAGRRRCCTWPGWAASVSKG